MANRCADNKAGGGEGGKRASSLCSGTRGDGRLCDALIILKQSLAGRPCIVQKSRGNSEKEEGGEGGWVVGVGPFVGWQTTRGWCGGRGRGESPLVDAFISRLRNPRSSDSRSTNRPCPRRGERGRDSTTPLGKPSKPQKKACRYAYLCPMTLAAIPPPPSRYHHLLADDFLRSAFNPCSVNVG